MSRDVETIRPDATIQEAASKMAALDVGPLPVCDGNRLLGMITDRDIVVRGLAEGRDPASTKVGELTKAQKEAVTIGADDDAEEILRTMSSHQVRRLPVIDGHDLIGIVAQADVARSLPDPHVGDLLEAISVG
jgi:CBS domain-containing protein